MDPYQLLEALKDEEKTFFFRFGGPDVFSDAKSSGHHCNLTDFELIVSTYGNERETGISLSPIDMDWFGDALPARQLCSEDPTTALDEFMAELERTGMIVPHSDMPDAYILVSDGGVCCAVFPDRKYDTSTHLTIFTGLPIDFPIDDGEYVQPEHVLAVYEVGSAEYEHFMMLYVSG